MSNDEKMRELLDATMPDVMAIKDLLDKSSIPFMDLARTLFLIDNVKRVSKWGGVKITIKNGEVVSITGENTFISEKELVNNLNNIRRK
jgi:hypothetical protein